MILSKISLHGFRNFKKAIIKVNEKTLVIGSNDVGKTNLLWAIRLLLDRSLSDLDIEPKDSDFYAYDNTNEFKILLEFNEVTEDCIVSKMKGKISDEDKMYLAYYGFRNPESKEKSFKIFAGPSKKSLDEIEERYYRKVLNLKYIGSRRDFYTYINREKGYLIQNAKEHRIESDVSSDGKLFDEIQMNLQKVDNAIPKLSYVAAATNSINSELDKLSAHNSTQKIVFDAVSSDADRFINNVSISSKRNDQNVLIGGDGRLNQIYLALWATRNELSNRIESEVSIVCIEEPEAHLHPHQQRKLADYLNKHIKGQVILTSHSPQIASEFSPNSIVRLLKSKDGTIAASDGCSEIIEESFIDFGYRMSIIPAEAFFADIVFLIEGPSEYVFYRTLAKQIGLDLDRLNISILMVDGIGFTPFIEILNGLGIEWVLRTDNDIFKIPKKDAYRYAGLERCISYYSKYYEEDLKMKAALEANHKNTKWPQSPTPPTSSINAMKLIREQLERFDLYLSDIDLENDMYNSTLKESIEEMLGSSDESDIIKEMQKHKATFMYDYLRMHKEELSKLSKDNLAKPLLRCKNYINKLNETD